MYIKFCFFVDKKTHKIHKNLNPIKISIHTVGLYAYFGTCVHIRTYSTTQRQHHSRLFSIDWAFCFNQTTCSNLHEFKCSHALYSMVVPFRHRALKHSNSRKLLQVTQSTQMIECEWESTRIWAMVCLSSTVYICLYLVHIFVHIQCRWCARVSSYLIYIYT